MIKRMKTKKIGRNQRPCICGKDIKYKKCCGKNNNGWTEMDFVVPIKETPSQSPKRPYLTKSVIEDLRNITFFGRLLRVRPITKLSLLVNMVL